MSAVVHIRTGEVETGHVVRNAQVAPFDANASLGRARPGAQNTDQ